MPRYRQHRLSWPRAFALLTVLALAACSGGDPKGRERTPLPAAGAKPNIIFVLTDDLSWNLIAHMTQVKQMQKDGLTFQKFFVADSLCCTSRATIFTGRYPHNTGVRTNFPPDGGHGVFKERGGEDAAYGPALQRAGYRTALMGKYLNGYQPADTLGSYRPYVPPGWNEWYVAGNGYPEYDYKLNENGSLVDYGRGAQDYLTDVLSLKGADFVKRSAAQAPRKPFFLQIATFAPHGPFVPAPRHAGAFPGLKAPRPPSFNEGDVSDKPSWLRSHPKLRPYGQKRIDEGFRDRVRMVQSVDDMVGRLRQTLKETGRDKDTYVVFGSDNGFHLGEHRLAGGKMTPYDPDVRVPYIVVGPGVPASRAVEAFAQNTDLAPTFLELAGVPIPNATDGRSLAPFLRGAEPSGWRDVALVEHVKPPPSAQDPDRQDSAPGAPPTYNALRTKNELYVEYLGGEGEHYDLSRDPERLSNGIGRLPPDRRQQLSALLYALTHCSGQGCTAAGRTQ